MYLQIETIAIVYVVLPLLSLFCFFCVYRGIRRVAQVIQKPTTNYVEDDTFQRAEFARTLTKKRDIYADKFATISMMAAATCIFSVFGCGCIWIVFQAVINHVGF